MAQGSNPPPLVSGLASDIVPRRARWLWADRVPTNALTLLGGREGIGKSTVWVTLSAKLSTGTLPGEWLGRPRATVVVATEDDWEHTIVPRLVAAGADRTKIVRCEALELPQDVARLGMLVAGHDAALMILDPLTSRVSGTLDTHKDSDTRQALEHLVDVLQKVGVACIGLIHVNKSAASEPLDTLMGSRAFPAVARSVLFVFADGEREGIRHLAHAKCNIAPKAPTLEFTILEKQIGDDDGPIMGSYVEWGAETTTTAYELNAESGGDREEQAARSDAAAWLRDYLMVNGGEAESPKVKSAGRAAGHSERTLQRAVKRAGATIVRRGMPAVVYWSIDPNASDDHG